MKFLGIDNGVSGSIAVLNDDGTVFLSQKTPIFETFSYTKEVQHIHRIHTDQLETILRTIPRPLKCAMERPLVNPMRFKATLSSMRALEATLIVLEKLEIPYEYADSKNWQHVLLPKGIYKKSTSKTGRITYKADSKELKKASIEIARRKFPELNIKDSGISDSLLIAYYLRLKDLGGCSNGDNK